MERQPIAAVITAASALHIAEAVRHFLEQDGFSVWQPGNSIGEGAVRANEILDALRRSDIALFDISGQDPNVMYELGVAHGLGKQTALLLNRESSGRVASDLVGLRYIVYDPDDPSRLEKHLRRLTLDIREYDQSREA